MPDIAWRPVARSASFVLGVGVGTGMLGSALYLIYTGFYAGPFTRSLLPPILLRVGIALVAWWGAAAFRSRDLPPDEPSAPKRRTVRVSIQR